MELLVYCISKIVAFVDEMNQHTFPPKILLSKRSIARIQGH